MVYPLVASSAFKFKKNLKSRFYSHLFLSQEKTYSVYTSVSKYENWISEKINASENPKSECEKCCKLLEVKTGSIQETFRK